VPARRPGDENTSDVPRARIQAKPIVVATISNRLPRLAWKPKADIRPPAIDIVATAIAATNEKRRRMRWPTAVAHCIIAQLAAANASTAASVCTKSCTVNNGLPGIGTGHPGVQVTCESTTKNPAAIHSDTDGVQIASHRGRERMSRAAQATRLAPSAMSSSVTWNARAVGMSAAPIPLT
jgi:hypothetical protein